MTDISQAAGSAAGAAVTGAVHAAEHAGATVISKIAAGVLVVWHDIEAAIEGDAQKVKNALPASALPGFDAVVSDIKQGASDTLSLTTTATVAAAPTLTKALEAAADTALATVTGGAALPLVPVVNAGIDELANLGIAALQAWALKAKAQLVSPASHG